MKSTKKFDNVMNVLVIAGFIGYGVIFISLVNDFYGRPIHFDWFLPTARPTGIVVVVTPYEEQFPTPFPHITEPVVYINPTPEPTVEPQFTWEWAKLNMLIPPGYHAFLEGYQGSEDRGYCENLRIVEDNLHSEIQFFSICRFYEAFPNPCPVDTLMVKVDLQTETAIVRFFDAQLPGWRYTAFGHAPWQTANEGNLQVPSCMNPPTVQLGANSFQVKSFYWSDPAERETALKVFDNLLRSIYQYQP